jgi:hypothetical protein
MEKEMFKMGEILPQFGLKKSKKGRIGYKRCCCWTMLNKSMKTQNIKAGTRFDTDLGSYGGLLLGNVLLSILATFFYCRFFTSPKSSTRFIKKRRIGVSQWDIVALSCVQGITRV